MTFEATLRNQYLERHPARAARLVERDPTVARRLQVLPRAELARLFDHLDPARIREIFHLLTDEQQVELLSTAGIRTVLMILRGLGDEERERLLERLPSGVSTELRKLLAFPEGSAGAYMDRPIAQFQDTMTVGEALERLRTSKLQRIRSVYVIGADLKLVGRVDVQDMAMADHDTPLVSITHPVEGVANLTSPTEELVDIFDAHRTDSVPIIDQEGKLLGVVRYTSLFQAAEDEATVDIQTMVGASADERALSPAWTAVRKRLPWLHINLLTAFLAASVVGMFESIIAQFTALAILLPVVAGQSGNAGSQALAVTIRGLALKEVSILQWRGVLTKEMSVGVVNGFALAATCGLGVFVWSQSWGLALVIAIAMVTSMIAAGIAGSLVPMILVRLGQDPATASSIILTTVTDVAGFMSFLGTATLLASLL
ncbi:MAG: magnesium transporter [Gammaproteobacteria bacterium]|nr:magnesium transporter [Gammaproteobacteria bacterium]